jgi:predicted dehydrogenase
MNLSPEEKAKGRADFADVSRRDFLKGGVLAAGVPAATLGAFYFGYEKIQGNPLRVAVLGTGDEGNVLIGALNPEYVEVKAIADLRPYNQFRAFHGDVYSPAALEARQGLMRVYDWKTESEARKHVAVYNDYRDLLEDYKKLGIEAVIIGLPLHLHAPASVAAMQRGLHVLTEKLMAHSVHECKEMAMVAAQTKRHLATGHQRHYNILYQEAVDTIKRGILGDIHYIRAQWHRGNMPGTDSWQMPMPKDIKPDDSQAERLEKELDAWKRAMMRARGHEIDNWAKKVAQKEAQLKDAVLAEGGEVDGREFKSAAEYGYRKETLDWGEGNDPYDRPAAEELLRWRLWKRTGGGLMVELGSHQLDAASIFLSAANNDKKPHPLSVMVAANRPIFGGDREVNDHISTIFEFPAPGYDANDPEKRRRKIGVQYSTINGNGFGGYGEIVFGTDGTLILERESDAQLYRGAATSRVKATSSSAGPALDTQASAPAQKAEASGPQRKVSRGYKEQIEHWAWCIRENPNVRDKEVQPRCHPKVALADAVISHCTNIAADPENDHFKRVNFKEAWFDPESPETPEGVKPDLSRYQS